MTDSMPKFIFTVYYLCKSSVGVSIGVQGHLLSIKTNFKLQNWVLAFSNISEMGPRCLLKFDFHLKPELVYFRSSLSDAVLL